MTGRIYKSSVENLVCVAVKRKKLNFLITGRKEEKVFSPKRRSGSFSEKRKVTPSLLGVTYAGRKDTLRKNVLIRRRVPDS